MDLSANTRRHLRQIAEDGDDRDRAMVNALLAAAGDGRGE